MGEYDRLIELLEEFIQTSDDNEIVGQASTLLCALQEREEH